MDPVEDYPPEERAVIYGAEFEVRRHEFLRSVGHFVVANVAAAWFGHEAQRTIDSFPIYAYTNVVAAFSAAGYAIYKLVQVGLALNRGDGVSDLYFKRELAKLEIEHREDEDSDD